MLEDLLHETSHLLSRVSTHTAVVVGPHTEAVTVRNVQLVSLQPSLVLALAILSTGVVEKCVLHLAPTSTTTPSWRATAALARRRSRARRWPLTHRAARGRARRGAADLAREARDALGRARRARRHRPALRGRRQPARGRRRGFPQPTNTARLLELLEHQVEVVSLVRDLLDEQGSRVSIGSENPLDELRDCSIVVAPYTVDGEVAGTVGVLGPTRMDYRQALAAVEAISQQLGRVLS